MSEIFVEEHQFYYSSAFSCPRLGNPCLPASLPPHRLTGWVNIFLVEGTDPFSASSVPLHCLGSPLWVVPLRLPRVASCFLPYLPHLPQWHIVFPKSLLKIESCWTIVPFQFLLSPFFELLHLLLLGFFFCFCPGISTNSLPSLTWVVPTPVLECHLWVGKWVNYAPFPPIFPGFSLSVGILLLRVSSFLSMCKWHLTHLLPQVLWVAP